MDTRETSQEGDSGHRLGEVDMAELVIFPGVRREILPSPQASEPEKPVEALTDAKVLQAAIQSEIQDVIVVGLSPDGTLYVASAVSDTDAIAGKLLRAANWMASSDYEEEYEYE